MRPPFILVLVLAALVGISFTTHSIDPYYFSILIFIGINMIMATSLNLINGFTGQFSLGHAGFMGTGAYIAAIVSTYMTTHGWGMEGASGAVVLGISLLAGGLFAAL